LSVLEGFRVIDFGQYIAGPLVGMLLADQGADVIRVEPPGGPRYDTPANATWNRGKRSIVLDLKKQGGVGDGEEARRDSGCGDRELSTGVMERLASARSRCRRSTHAWSTARCLASPLMTHELVCRLGKESLARPHRPIAARVKGRPGRLVYTPIPIASCYAAFMGTVSIAMALFARERDGLGQRIEVPLFDAMYPSLGNRVVRIVGPGSAGAVRGGLWGGQFGDQGALGLFWLG
jgi:crotonobetainyl-CoA:carnitine CoA-transferase CaiB-like acyl-CoA transferase